MEGERTYRDRVYRDLVTLERQVSQLLDARGNIGVFRELVAFVRGDLGADSGQSYA
jgi:hypothetical protein